VNGGRAGTWLGVLLVGVAASGLLFYALCEPGRLRFKWGTGTLARELVLLALAGGLLGWRSFRCWAGKAAVVGAGLVVAAEIARWLAA
jgi:hypothetical protein